MLGRNKEPGEPGVATYLSTNKQHYKQYQKSHFTVLRTLGYYSLDPQFQFTMSCLGLRRLIADPKSIIGKNIWDGFDETEWDKRSALGEKYVNSRAIEQIIRWEQENTKELNLGHVDFVLKRAQLRKILRSPYSNGSGKTWQSDVFIKNDRIYLSENADLKAVEEPMSTSQKKMSYGGYAFEELVGELTGTESNVECSQDGRYYSVYLAEMSGTSSRPFRFLMSGEMDGTDGTDDQLHDFKSFVEVKTISTDAVFDQSGKVNFKFFKKYDSWLSCYMSGIEKLCVGERDQNGNICEVHMLNPMQDLRGIDHAKAVTMNFASSFFNWVKAIVIEENVVYRFSFDPIESFVSCKKLFGEEADVLKVLQK